MSRFGEIACLLSVWAVVVCAGCGSSGSRIDFLAEAKEATAADGVALEKTYRDTKHGFSFQHPENWRASKDLEVAAYVHGPLVVDDPPAVRVLVNLEGQPGALSSFQKKLILKEIQHGNKEVLHFKMEYGLFDGRDAHRAHYIVKTNDGYEREALVYLVYVDGKFVTVGLSASTAMFGETEKTLRAVLASFRFFEPLPPEEQRKEEAKVRKQKRREEKAAVDFVEQAREGLGDADGVELSKTFKDVGLGIRFKYPKTWRRGRSDDPDIRTYIHGESVNDFCPNVTFLTLRYEEEMELLSRDDWEGLLKRDAPDFSLLGFEKGRFAGKNAIFLHIQDTNEDDIMLESWVYYIHSGCDFIVLRLCDGHDNFAVSEPIFRSILASFEFPMRHNLVSSRLDDDEDESPFVREPPPPAKPSLAEQALAVELDELLDDEDLPFAIRYPSGWKASVKKSKYRVNLNRPFNDFKTRLSFRHPSTWRQERMQGYHATVAGPVADGFPPCVTLALEPPSKDIFTMTETQALKNLQKGNKSASIKQFEKGRFAGRKAIRQHVVVTRADGKTIEAWMYRIDTGKECLVLTLGDLQTNFAKSKPLFEEILASARLPDYEVDAQEDFVGVLASNLRITEPEDIVLLTGPAGADGHKPTLRLTNYIETSLAGEIAMTRADAKQVPKGDIRPGSAVLIPVGGRTTRFECSIDVTDKAKPVESLVGVRTISIQPVRICLTDSSAGFEESLAVFAAMLQSFQERKK